jgi:hypothetical protein
MIRAVHIARFRGIRECVADGFGRVNLVIGKNDCGKTAFMEALQLADGARDAAYLLLQVQAERLGRGVKRRNFERFWRPIFHDLDAKAGLSLWITRQGGTVEKLEIRQGEVPDEAVFSDADGQSILDEGTYDASVKLPTWALDLEIIAPGKEPLRQRIVSTALGLKLPRISSEEGSFWISSSPAIGEAGVKMVSGLKQRGHDGALVELLRAVDGRLSGIEILAPGGDVAELFVRLDNGTPMLPVTLMGDGFQRALEIGAVAAAHGWPTLFIDEIENGMHHLVMEPLWRWIATLSRRRNLQVFATTHSEECINAACQAFQELDDDGLRVIRLDRLESGTRATIYDRALVEAAERTGTEIRG